MKNKIDYWRNREGMTYRGVADLAGVSPQYVYMLAKGKRRNPCLFTMKKIAAALGKTFKQVFVIQEPQ